MANFFDMCDISVRQANMEVNQDPEVREELAALTEQGAEYWKSIAPVGDPKKDPHSGQYKESIHTHEGKGFAVIADAPNAWFVEYGTNGIHESACRARTEAYLKKRVEIQQQSGGGEG